MEGKRIRITDPNGHYHVGTFLGETEKSIIYMYDDGTETAMSKRDVIKIEVIQ
jgi:hypothetical protein